MMREIMVIQAGSARIAHMVASGQELDHDKRIRSIENWPAVKKRKLWQAC